MPQVFTPVIPTPEQRMINRIAALMAKRASADELEELDVILHLLGVDD